MSGKSLTKSGVNRLATEKIAYESAMSKAELTELAFLGPLAEDFRFRSTECCFLATYGPSIPDNTTSMASRKKKRSKKSLSSRSPTGLAESRTSEAVTVGWTVTLTTVFFCNLAAVAAHFYVAAHPEAQRMAMLRELLLLSGALVGLLSLALLPLVKRFRQTPPPRGLVAFGVCIAMAPILVVALRAIR